jgi:hypothetical protein
MDAPIGSRKPIIAGTANKDSFPFSVPAGKTLVIEFVFNNTGNSQPGPGVMLINCRTSGEPAGFIFPAQSAQLVKIYADGGTTVTGRIANGTATNMGFSGYLE